MQIITLHNTDTEEIMGSVYPIEKIDFDEFFDEVYKTFSNYHKIISDEYDYHYDIDDFVEYHNDISKIKIDSAISEYIQL